MRKFYIFHVLIIYLFILVFSPYRAESQFLKWFRLTIPEKPHLFNDSSYYNNSINWIDINNGHFIKRNNGKRIKFFGSTVGWTYPNASHDAIDRSVEYIKSLGLNCIRIHYPGLWNSSKETFNPSYIEKFDYLTYSLSRHKIYYIIYSLNMVYLNYKGRKGLDFRQSRIVTLMDSSYKEGIKIFWDSLMNHRNIYTGIKYKNDSALAFIILTNENSVDKLLRTKGGKKLLRIYWDLYKGKYGFSNIEFPESENSKTYKYLLQFAAKEDSSYFVNMKSFLRGIGVKVPMTFTNNPYTYYTQKTLSKIVDFVGVHTYGNIIGGKKGGFFKDPSPLVFANAIPGDFPTRIFTVNYKNKPVIVDEWNVSYPSRHRLDVSILIPTLSSYYNYDGVLYFLLFAHSNYIENPNTMQSYYLTSLENPYSMQALFLPSISYAMQNNFIPKNMDSLVVNISDDNKIIGDSWQYRYNPFYKEKGIIYYFKRIIFNFSNRSNLDSIQIKYPNLNIITTKNVYWDFNRGIFGFVSDRFFAYTGSISGNWIFRNYMITSSNKNISLTMIPLDKKDIFYSGKIFITIAENSFHNGDDRLIELMKYYKGYSYYPSYIEQKFLKRIPASILVKNVNCEIQLPHNNSSKSFSLFAVFPDGKKQFIKNIKTKKNNIIIKIESGLYKTCYYMIESRSNSVKL